MNIFTKIMVIFLFSNLAIFAQIFQGPASGSVASGVTVNTGNFTEEGDLPPGFKPKPIQNKFMTMKLPNVDDGVQPTAIEGANYFEDPLIYSTEKPKSGDFSLTKNFQGIQDQGMYIPPDPYLAVGPNHIIAVVNSRFRIMDKSGTVLKTIEANTWYNSTMSNSDPFDPKVIYDHFSNRWVMVWLNVGASTAYFLISVSDDSDPTGVWYNWKLPTHVNGTTSAGNWADYQGVGFDQNALYITSNQFTFAGSFSYAKIRIVPKSDLYAATPGVVNYNDLWDIKTPFPSVNVFGLRPTRNYDTSTEYYLVNNSPYVTGNYFVVYRLTNPLTTPSLTAVNVPVTSYTDPNDAGQLGTSITIDGGDSGMRNEPVVKDGVLHLTHSVRSGTGGAYSSVRYCSINLSTNTAITDVAMGSDTYFHTYPALAVDNNNNVLLTYTRTGTNEYAGAYYTSKLAGGTTLTGSRVIKPGNGTYNKTFGGSRNRWGDYNGAWTDPSATDKIYTLTEYVASTNTWGSWIGELTFAEITNSITVTAPDGGEHWVVGTSQNITWTNLNVTNVKIEYSTNNGTNWIEIATNLPATPGSYAFTVPNTESGLCLVKVSDVANPLTYDVSNGTFTISTQTSAYDWEIITSPVSTDLTGVSIVNSSVAWISGNAGVVLRSLDGGTTWTKVTTVTGSPDLYSISAISDQKAIVGDGSGNIFRTGDGGTTWTKVSTNTGSFINVVDYVSENLAYAQGDPVSSVWKLLKSTDDGMTWTLATSLAAASGEAGWNGAYDRLGTNVWFGTNKTKIYKSATGFEGPWTSGTTGTSVNSYGIAFSDANKGIAVVNDGTATGGKVMKTNDGGATWLAVSFPTTGMANLADFVDGTPNVWVGTFSNGILHSTDYGNTWVIDRLPASVAGVNAIKVYPDVSNGLAVGPGGLILKSTMSGVIPVELTNFAANVSGSVVNLAWKTATETNNQGFEIQRKVNNEEWTAIGFRAGMGTTTTPVNYTFSDDLNGLNTNFAEYRLKQVDFDGSFAFSSIVKVENVLPKAFSLEQNYPNPFNPSTKINFTLPSTSNVRLEVYAVNGEKVATLINEVKNAGFHSFDFNYEALSGKVLSSGMYIYRLSSTDVVTGDVYSQARKMMLIK